MISSETSAGLENLTRLGQLRWLFLDLGDVDAEALTKLSRLTQIDNLAFGGKKGNEVSMVKTEGDAEPESPPGSTARGSPTLGLST